MRIIFMYQEITLIKFLFPYPKPFLDICFTYDGLVSTILSRSAYGSRDFFINVDKVRITSNSHQITRKPSG